MIKQHLFTLITIILSFTACQNNRHLTGELSQDINVSFERFERDFQHINDPNTTCDKLCMFKKYDEFFHIYNEGILHIGNMNNPNYDIQTNHFLNDSIYLMVYDTVAHYFPSLETEEAQLTKVFQNYNRVFNERTIPRFITHISGFNEAIVVSDSVLSVSLENYLGEEHIFYQNLGIHNYQRPHKNRENLVVDAVRGWISSDFPETSAENNLLGQIIHEGKILYIMQTLMPKTPEYAIIGLSPDQYHWCEQNEGQLWSFMITQKHLFSNLQLIIAKYVNDGPFFNFWGEGSSPLVGKYIGWKIVSEYMDSNKDTSIDELLRNTNSQNILQKSSYKPQ